VPNKKIQADAKNARLILPLEIMTDFTINQVEAGAEASQLDGLLWDVLWKPIDLPRNIRDSFTLNGEYLELVARSDAALVGGLVADWTSPTEIEIRHIAVRPENQKQGVGARLVTSLLQHLSARHCRRLHAIARNTSAGFFRKLGFSTAPGEPPEHPLFKKHGITFELLEKIVEPTDSLDKK